MLVLASLGWLGYISLLFLGVLLGFSLFVHLAASSISRIRNATKRKLAFALAILGVLANLAFFKYYDFFRAYLPESVSTFFGDLVLPLGISYYSFQAIAYLHSIYLGNPVALKAQNLLLHFAFFPTITAGPIARVESFKNGKEHYAGMKEQLEPSTIRNIITPSIALTLIVLGIAKKWWLSGSIGDNFVTPVFENPLQYDALSLLTAIYGYTFQLFFDFSGYSDLVIGLAMLLGFQLPRNFNMPLSATNLKEFWHRWHISLSTWIRDYIYIPLGGSRHGFLRTQIAILLAMTASGIWHGYGLNFFVWGLLHGFAFVLLNIGDKLFAGRKLSNLPIIGKVLSLLITFNFVALAFVIFRTNSFDETLEIYSALFNNTLPWQNAEFATLLMGATLLGLVLCYRWIGNLFNAIVQYSTKLPLVVWGAVLLIGMVFIIIFAPSGIPNFIYANF